MSDHFQNTISGHACGPHALQMTKPKYESSIALTFIKLDVVYLYIRELLTAKHSTWLQGPGIALVHFLSIYYCMCYTYIYHFGVGSQRRRLEFNSRIARATSWECGLLMALMPALFTTNIYHS